MKLLCSFRKIIILFLLMEDTNWLSRTTVLIGEEKLQKLINAHVAIIGLGGVGSYAAEFICRSGVGTMTIVDGDVVEPTNRNRQLPALASNHGESKADIIAEFHWSVQWARVVNLILLY